MVALKFLKEMSGNISFISIPIALIFVDKGTGIITTTRITHATPGAAYAHTPNRNWEVDWQLENVTEKANCTDIASQLIDKKNLKV